MRTDKYLWEMTTWKSLVTLMGAIWVDMESWWHGLKGNVEATCVNLCSKGPAMERSRENGGEGRNWRECEVEQADA